LKKPVWTDEDREAQKEAEEKAEAWFRRDCGCLGYGCLPFMLPFCLLPFVWFVS
jgi:hypothetical protein